MRKRSVLIAGHRTSVSLEAAFWSDLKEIAEARGLSVNRLVETIDQGRRTNLSSAIRVFVLGCRHRREVPPAVPPVVPELDVADLARSRSFYETSFGFACRFERQEEGVAYLVLGDAHLMLRRTQGPGRRFCATPLEPPFGRGLDLRIRVSDIDRLYARVLATGAAPCLPLEERRDRQDDGESTGEENGCQFVVEDPDGHLLRFFGDPGQRAAQNPPAHTGGGA